MKKQKKFGIQNGITLMALIITIIIMSIISGITIYAFTGDKGLFKNAILSRDKSELQGDKEKVRIVIHEYTIKRAQNGKMGTELSDDEMKDLAKQFDDDKFYYVYLTSPKEGKLIIDGEENFTELHVRVKKKSKYEFIIDKNLNIIKVMQGDQEIKFDEENTVDDNTNNTIDDEPKEPVIVHKTEVPEGWIGIYNEDDLKSISNDLTGKYILMSDIDLTIANASISNWTPIGNNSQQFKGKLDGNFYKISNLQVVSNTHYQGLFGYMNGTEIFDLTIETTDTGVKGVSYVGILAGYSLNATIDNVVIKGNATGTGDFLGGLIGYNDTSGGNSTISNVKTVVNLSGRNYVGGTIGYNYNNSRNQNYNTLVTQCYNEGTIKASGVFIGGLIGRNYIYGGTSGKTKVERSASSANIEGVYQVGGIIGRSEGVNSTYMSVIENCYSMGTVNQTYASTGDEVYSGGLMGWTYWTTISNSYTISKVTSKVGGYAKGLVGWNYGNTTATNTYWMKEQSGCADSPVGIVTTVTWLITKANVDKYWNTTEIWGIEDKVTLPYLNGITIPDGIYIVKNGYKTYEQGDGTKEKPYIIETEAQLRRIGDVKDAYYSIAKDIALTSGWTPVGTNAEPFKGKVEGNNHKITGLEVNSTGDYQGFFGYLNGAEIKDLTIETTTKGVNGRHYVGILAGYSLNSTVENVTIKGNSTATGNYIGGLIGYNYALNGNNKISKCYSEGIVKSNGAFVGGIVGYNYVNSGTKNTNTKIEKSASSANVEGVYQVGGLIGRSEGINTTYMSLIENCYSVGTVNQTYTSTGTELCSGGLIGWTYYTGITNSYTISKVTSRVSGYAHGVVGYNRGYSSATNTYWTKTQSGCTDSPLGTVIADDKKSEQSSYVGFDFKEDDKDTDYVWYMKNGYPDLKNFLKEEK